MRGFLWEALSTHLPFIFQDSFVESLLLSPTSPWLPRVFVLQNSFRSTAGWILLLRCLCLPWAAAGFLFLSAHTSCSCVWGTSGILRGLNNLATEEKQHFLLQKVVNTKLLLFFHSSTLFTERRICLRNIKVSWGHLSTFYFKGVFLFASFISEPKQKREIENRKKKSFPVCGDFFTEMFIMSQNIKLRLITSIWASHDLMHWLGPQDKCSEHPLSASLWMCSKLPFSPLEWGMITCFFQVWFI